MQCPACDRELCHVRAGTVEVDACHGGCGGIWFDAFEMQKLDQPEESAGELLLNLTCNPEVTVDLERRRNCPRCDGIVMLRHSHKNSESVVIDECPGCGGFWLDAGELAMIRESFVEARRKREHTQALLEELKKKSLAELNTEKQKHRTHTLTRIHGFFAA
jgi:Zn-finger nucleic acid-binding protein